MHGLKHASNAPIFEGVCRRLNKRRSQQNKTKSNIKAELQAKKLQKRQTFLPAACVRIIHVLLNLGNEK
jgi:hypothetical protein